jgi:hypothetical protein
VKTTSVPGSGEWFMTLSTPRMISGAVYKWPSLYILCGIDSGVQDTGSLTLVLHNLLLATAVVLLLALVFPVILAFSPKDGSR